MHMVRHNSLRTHWIQTANITHNILIWRFLHAQAVSAWYIWPTDFAEIAGQHVLEEIITMNYVHF